MPRVLKMDTGDVIPMPPGQEAEARRFYGQVLGLRETMKPPGEKGVWFQTEGGLLKIVPTPDFKPHQAQSAPVAKFRVDKAEAMRMALDKARYRHHDAPHVVGTRGFYAHDAWGNRVELREFPPGS